MLFTHYDLKAPENLEVRRTTSQLGKLSISNVLFIQKPQSKEVCSFITLANFIWE